MKSKLKCLRFVSFSIITCLVVYLFHLNFVIGRYEASIDKSYEANYLEVDQDTNFGLAIANATDVIEQEQTLVEEVVEEPLMYDGKTVDEIAQILDRSLNSDIAGKGYLIASHSIELGVDPYMAAAIMLQETGCKWECSALVKSCNNVGGQKGSGCGSYSYFETLDGGIIAFIDNLYNNYVSYGLTTPEAINPKYAEDFGWSYNVNRYIESIKAQ